jgi:ATP-dependent HslUV protease ATP-binding subunit HslU
VELSPLSKEDFVRILTEPKGALVRQYQALLATEGLTVDFSKEGLEEIADIAVQVNDRTENIGARRLFTIMERLLEQIAFEGPEWPDKRMEITADYVRERLKDIVKDQDLSRYIL